MNYTRLGQRIREERLRLNLSQSRLSEDIDISTTYMGQIERGERSLTLDTLVRLVNRLGVSIDYLLKDYVDLPDDNAIDQFKQMFDGQSNSRKQMAVDVVRTMFAHLDGE